MTEVLDSAIDFLTMVAEDDYVNIYFIKKNGEKRLMKATLNFKKIPKEHHPKGYNLKGILKKIKSSKVLSVFDLEKVAWRSIKLDSIIWIKSSKNKMYEFKIPMASFQSIGI
jgi:hypothetical protein